METMVPKENSQQLRTTTQNQTLLPQDFYDHELSISQTTDFLPNDSH